MQIPADSLRRVIDSVFASPAYAWRADDATLTTVARWWRDLIAWIAGLRAANPQGYRVFVALLIAVLLGILIHAAWVFVRTVRGAAEPASGAARMPERAARDAGWYARRADELADAGRFREALQHAFTAVALRLDAAGRVRYDPSRTPAELAREAQLDEPDRVRLRNLVRTLYEAVFGGAPFGKDEYREWRALAAAEWHASAH